MSGRWLESGPEPKEILTMAEELVFVVDDDPNLRRIMTVLLEKNKYKALEFESGEDCLEKLEENPSAIFLDKVMPGLDGVETLKRIKSAAPDIPVIMVTSIDAIDSVVNVIKLGAYDYLTKPVDETRLFTTLEKALEQHSLVRHVQHLQGELKHVHGQKEIIGNSKAIELVLEKVHKVKDSRAGVLILGESGTGKELLARAIHYNSPFAKGLFVDINCAAIPETLQDTELFGHKKGAFTGAVESRTGRLEMADGGTLFLDEVAEMSLNTQKKLLRFLQEKYFERVGENKKIHVNARVIAATNKDLIQEVAKGNFREDLYYRLAVFPITLPPLRERKDDIPLLCAHLMRKHKEDLNKAINSITPRAMKRLMEYDWPGNVRQLENVVYQSMIMAETARIDEQCLPPEILAKRYKPEGIAPSISNDETPPLVPPRQPMKESDPGETEIIPHHEVEKRMLEEALKKTHGNIPQAAKKLGFSRSTFYRMVKKYQLK